MYNLSLPQVGSTKPQAQTQPNSFAGMGSGAQNITAAPMMQGPSADAGVYNPNGKSVAGAGRPGVHGVNDSALNSTANAPGVNPNNAEMESMRREIAELRSLLQSHRETRPAATSEDRPTDKPLRVSRRVNDTDLIHKDRPYLTGPTGMAGTEGPQPRRYSVNSTPKNSPYSPYNQEGQRSALSAKTSSVTTVKRAPANSSPKPPWAKAAEHQSWLPFSPGLLGELYRKYLASRPGPLNVSPEERSLGSTPQSKASSYLDAVFAEQDRRLARKAASDE